MPTQHQQVLTNTELLQHILDIAKLVGPFIVVIISLVVYVWSRLEKTQEKLEGTLIDHIKENDAVHDKVFGELRDTRHELDVLLGEHKHMLFTKKRSELSKDA